MLERSGGIGDQMPEANPERSETLEIRCHQPTQRDQMQESGYIDFTQGQERRLHALLDQEKSGADGEGRERQDVSSLPR